MSILSVGSPILDQATGGIASLLNPVNDLVTYLVPRVAPLFGDTVKLRRKPDESIDHIVPFADRVQVVSHIDALAASSGIKRKVLPYASMNSKFSSYGGKWSLTHPVLKLPYQHLFRSDGLGLFGAEKDHGALHQSNWRFTDHETSFLILKELGKIKQNDAVLKLAARVVILAALLSFQFFSFDLMLSIALIIGAGVFHTAVDRFYQNRNDAIAVKDLGIHLKNPVQAAQAAIRAVEKSQYQNQYLRNTMPFGKLLIKENGDNRLNLSEPSFSKRIKKLKEFLVKAEAQENQKRRREETAQGGTGEEDQSWAVERLRTISESREAWSNPKRVF